MNRDPNGRAVRFEPIGRMDTPERTLAGWPPAGDEYAAQVEQCHTMGWTDGLPVLPPTPERVDALLGPWIGRRHEPVSTLPPAQGEATLETIAANCVLAGCIPDHLPVVVAAVQAMADRRFNLDAAVTGVNSVSPVVIVDGPIVERLGFNSEAGALTAGNRANGAVGRAVQLCIRNIGGAGLGGIDAATHGHPGKYSYLIAGWPASPWEPLRTRLGFAAGDSTVTVYSAEAPLCIADMGHDDPLSILRTIARSAAIPGSYNAYFRQELWLVLSPEHAMRLAGAGMEPDRIAAFIHDQATIPAGDLRGHGLYGFVDESLPPTWIHGAGDSDRVSIVDGPDRVRLVVAGGLYGAFTSVLLGQGVSVSRRVEPW